MRKSLEAELPGVSGGSSAQRLNEVTHRYGRETKRFREVGQLIAYALGGRPGEQLSRRLEFPVSNDSLLNRVK
jgi:hypothetical protein